MDKFFARRLHSINQYKNAGLRDVIDLPIKFISYLNKPENIVLREKYLGSNKQEKVIASKNNELQATWPILKFMDINDLFN